jgi:hypothetical protein
MNSDARELLIEVDRILAVVESLRTRSDRFRRENLPILGRTDISANFAAQLLDNTYTALETLFLRVSQHFENSLDTSHWHTDLLDKMKIHVAGVREQVLSEKAHALLLELLKFRHFRRYYFDVELDWEKIDFLLRVYDRALPLVKADIERFKDFLRRLAED